MNTCPKLELLIVDDDPVVALMHARVLKDFTFETKPRFLSNGVEALEFIKTHSDPDTTFLVFLDLLMPVMDGWDFLDQCKDLDNQQQICVFVITSSILSNDLFRALKYKNVMGFSNKPFTRESMISLLDFPAVKDLFLQMEYEALEDGTW